MEAERRNYVVHSPSTLLNANADEVGRYATSQDLRKAECTILKAGTAEDALRKPAERSDRILRLVSHRYNAAPRDPGYAEQESGGREQAKGVQLVPWPEQEFNGFLEAVPDAAVIADRDGRIIRVNAQAEKLFGYAGRDGARETGHVSAESPPRRILVADDNGDLVEAVAQVLRRRGHEVCVSGDGPAALEGRCIGPSAPKEAGDGDP